MLTLGREGSENSKYFSQTVLCSCFKKVIYSPGLFVFFLPWEQICFWNIEKLHPGRIEPLQLETNAPEPLHIFSESIASSCSWPRCSGPLQLLEQASHVLTEPVPRPTSASYYGLSATSDSHVISLEGLCTDGWVNAAIWRIG